jgi:hypothetical protein
VLAFETLTPGVGTRSDLLITAQPEPGAQREKEHHKGCRHLGQDPWERQPDTQRRAVGGVGSDPVGDPAAEVRRDHGTFHGLKGSMDPMERLLLGSGFVVP